MDYDERVDIWSAGCIFVEMKIGTPLFGDLLKPQLIKHILQVTGGPDEIMMQKINSEYSRSYIKNMDIPPKLNMADIFPWASAELLDLLSKMLELDPDRRLKASEALKHPYFQKYHDEENEEVGTPWRDPLLDEVSLTENEWRDATWNFLNNFEQTVLSSQNPGRE
ncbi:unnamed protein product [Hymenolepis diminuta]|uniref:Protein kinase domain-containing protein n=1 Tax=Hymenolepis diminuta TaxID=6216 RepID=A0A564YLI8_HYMDI|nr:unnamed protein product [Hymenolepis diminuta]VUZ50285.1 unnamed protein product [Hymenolepis diminuta]